MTTHDLAWIAPFWQKIRPIVFLRLEDEVLILPPNRVFKLNATAQMLLRRLDADEPLDALPGITPQRRTEIHHFFTALEAAMRGETPVAERVPFTFDFTRWPVLGEIAVTYRCNNRCRFCYAGCSAGASACAAPPGRHEVEDLPTAALLRVIDIFKEEARIPFFSFTGGEPLLRPDLEVLIAHAHDLGLKTNLVTNGTLATPERAQSLYDAGLRTAQLSIEAPDAALHDALCGVPGAYARTIAGIAALQQAGIAVQCNTTALRPNLDVLAHMPALAARLKVVRMSMNLFIPTQRSPESDALFVPYREIGPVVDRVRKAAHRHGVDFLWYSPTPLCLYNPIARGLGNKSCAACDGLLSVDPQARVLPCSSWDQPLGSLLDQGFQDIWFGQRAQMLKNKAFAPQACQSCGAFTACQGACPLYWDYAGYDEIDVAGPRFRARYTATNTAVAAARSES